MGIFDRIAGVFERNNPDAVYTAELQRLDGRIAEVTATAASLATGTAAVTSAATGAAVPLARL